MHLSLYLYLSFVMSRLTPHYFEHRSHSYLSLSPDENQPIKCLQNNCTILYDSGKILARLFMQDFENIFKGQEFY